MLPRSCLFVAHRNSIFFNDNRKRKSARPRRMSGKLVYPEWATSQYRRVMKATERVALVHFSSGSPWLWTEMPPAGTGYESQEVRCPDSWRAGGALCSRSISCPDRFAYVTRANETSETTAPPSPIDSPRSWVIRAMTKRPPRCSNQVHQRHFS